LQEAENLNKCVTAAFERNHNEKGEEKVPRSWLFKVKEERKKSLPIKN
jgi:hypothetical protein